MKKFFSIILLGFMLFFITGCNELEDATIYSTVYPIQYLAETLYGNHSNISQIYPDGADVKNYEINDKLIDKFSKGSLFLYNGTTDEKQIAKTLVNERKKLKIIDVAYSLKYKFGVEELWLSPSNYLMLASNLRDGLKEQIGTKYVNEEIEEKYHKLEETLSTMDAEIRSIAKNAKKRNQNTIIVSSNVFQFLKDYGFEVVSLEDYETNTASLNTLKNQFKSGTYKYILAKEIDENNERVSEIRSQCGGNVVTVPMMHTLSEERKKNNDNYLSIMNQFIENLKVITNY